eukprot:CAMPEP_0197635924 /NCGR_PEP_ID=MMETSP1338-20131121/11595_1 /TAXON_ID=43686 ORGANISM="Pelagodinium beii, Strain RCC1491" /NCGR_SAMPLE_ID=MMETSP1338 /ASSEMBLY_ACC=CAM_ASM_000754 /LENGTH=363 /DNA_ID=CAMNT_0043208065 /DNA_START=41 /DNA_END=1132 /DNA_ORIENTATION=-
MTSQPVSVPGEASHPALEISMGSTGDCILCLQLEEAEGMKLRQVKALLRKVMPNAASVALRLIHGTRVLEDHELQMRLSYGTRALEFHESQAELWPVESPLQLQVVIQAEMEVSDIREAIPDLLEQAMVLFDETVLELKSIKPSCLESLESLVSVIISKACSEPLHAHKMAELATAIQSGYAKFHCKHSDHSPAATVTFRKILLDGLQNEYEQWTENYLALESDLPACDPSFFPLSSQMELERRKKAMLARLIFIASLCKSKMVAFNVVRDVVDNLIEAHDATAISRHKRATSKLYIAECACHVIKTLGATTEMPIKTHGTIYSWIVRLGSLYTSWGYPPDSCLKDFLDQHQATADEESMLKM